MWQSACGGGRAIDQKGDRLLLLAVELTALYHEFTLDFYCHCRVQRDVRTIQKGVKTHTPSGGF
jgi:hypothetical protein